jgi:hypothetical protein
MRFKKLLKFFLQLVLKVSIDKGGKLRISFRGPLNIRPYLKSESGERIYLSALNARVFRQQLLSFEAMGLYEICIQVHVFGYIYHSRVASAFMAPPTKSGLSNTNDWQSARVFSVDRLIYVLIQPVLYIDDVKVEHLSMGASVSVSCSYSYSIESMLNRIALKRRDNGSLIPLSAALAGGRLTLAVPIEALADENLFVNDSRWDIALSYHEKKSSFKLSVIGAFDETEGEESRYLAKATCKESKLFVAYLTEGVTSLAFWFVDKKRFGDVYRIAEGKTVYKNALQLPVENNLVVFESFFGKSYSGNPKYIYEYMQKTFGSKYTYVWSYNKTAPIPGNPIIVERGSKEYFR